ncbi:hypothetical protein CYLTODRAFT_457867 [Cylindrobasidium torrendii FP15055 ss-10]|uniref:Non-ribosomal peptide synthetase n=1 Tax=Cylindrobasidium torrendii FP15055 ss-10 TaxID=1314674 RepID=A0A0D7B0P6_9AGAR|nr:hypothetical protein CYLTODRAFT_457867 [Cylindrobasidium torrendii FP15055 ss-10]
MASELAYIDAEKGHAEEVYYSQLQHNNSTRTLVAIPEHKPVLLRSGSNASTATIVAPPPSKYLSFDELSAIKRSTKTPAPLWVKFRLWFNAYKRLFTICFLFNFIALLCAATGRWTYPREYTGAFILGNLLIGVLVRTELFARILYAALASLFAKWSPLWFRLGISSTLQHLGGVHTGCASSAVMWLIFKMTLVFKEFDMHQATLAFGVLTTMSVGAAMIFALPWIRNHHHNVFERNHRMFGWLGLLFTWIFVFLGDSWDSETRQFYPGRAVRQQDFWFCLLMTCLILAPWVTVRCVPVEITVPSSKVAIIKFERGMQQGLLARVSHGPLWEYHAFGIISEGVHAKEHYLIAGVQGDFTRGLVDNPPTHLWTRELKVPAIGNTSSLYRRGIRVCTGTGLGAALSTCIQNDGWYLVWMGSDQEKTFGPIISGLIDKHLVPKKRVTLWDSKARGCRPDAVRLVKDIYDAWGAEVVMITSNAGGNKELMEGLTASKIPCFGTLWDF